MPRDLRWARARRDGRKLAAFDKALEHIEAAEDLRSADGWGKRSATPLGTADGVTASASEVATVEESETVATSDGNGATA